MLVFFWYALLCILSSFVFILMRKRGLVVLLMSCYCKCSGALPYVAIDLSAVCDCGIFPDHTHLLYAYIFLYFVT